MKLHTLPGQVNMYVIVIIRHPPTYIGMVNQWFLLLDFSWRWGDSSLIIILHVLHSIIALLLGGAVGGRFGKAVLMKKLRILRRLSLHLTPYEVQE